MKSKRVDVLVVGGGTAGAATALALARVGARVLVVDRGETGPVLGETLPPQALALLQQLGLEDVLDPAKHLPSYGTRSAWSGPTLRDRDFIRNPPGVGWHLNRQEFDRSLGEAARRAGAEWLGETRAIACERTKISNWTVSLRSRTNQERVLAGVLIDASGRARLVARAQGACRCTYDRLVAIVGVLSPQDSRALHEDTRTVVEAVDDGWWYASPLPNGQLVAGYMTDADLVVPVGAKSTTGWLSLLAQTVHVRHRVFQNGYQLSGPLQLVCADSSCLATASGDGWIAVGDAAAARDPLSSQGLAMALKSGQHAAAELGAAPGSKGRYDEWLRETYARFLALRLGYYAQERRWSNSRFWRRRHDSLRLLFAG